jgi:hypothetical protein
MYLTINGTAPLSKAARKAGNYCSKWGCVAKRDGEKSKCSTHREYDRIGSAARRESERLNRAAGIDSAAIATVKYSSVRRSTVA